MKEQTRYVKRWRLAKSRGVQFAVDAAPTRRKIQALEAIGHTRTSIAAEMGVTVAAVSNLMRHDTIRPTTEAAVEQVYRAMCMRVAPDTREARKARQRARENGWPPPLDWDDIHAGILLPPARDRIKTAPHDRLDHEEIDYVMQYGKWAHPLSRLEKIEVVRRWIANGGSEAELCRLTGWAQGRYRVSPTITQEAS